MKITETQFMTAYRSAGAWFVAMHAEIMLDNINPLNNNLSYKEQFINDIYTNENCDSDMSGTSTRVNCVMRIINSGRLKQALKMISVSDRIDANAVKTAKKLLDKLNSEEANA